MALQYAAEEMRVDRDVVLNAVQSDGLALQFASGPALMDHAVVLAADSMKKNREIMEKAVTTSPKALAYVPSELQKDALEVVKSSPEAVLQLERSMTEQQVERMEEMAVTRRHAKESEKEQERLQKWLDLMKSVRPQDPSVISRARQAIEKQFDTTTDEDKMDYVDVLLDNSIAMHATLKNSLFKCLVEYKLKLADKVFQSGEEVSSPQRQSQSLAVETCVAELSWWAGSRAVHGLKKESAANGRPPEVQANMSSSVQALQKKVVEGCPNNDQSMPQLQLVVKGFDALVHELQRTIGNCNCINRPNVEDLVPLTFLAYPDRVAFTMSGTADGRQERFEKPWLMTFIMFVSMTLALPFDAGMWRKSSPEPLLGGQVADRWREKVIKVMYPAFFDILATGLCCMGFLYIPASVWQLLRGAEIVFAAIFAVTCLHRRLYCFQYIGLAFCVAGIFLVGLASVWGDDMEAEAKGKDSGNVQLLLIGICLALAGQVVQAAQAVAEEWLLRDVDLPGLQVVGFEGVWGALAMLVFVFPTLYMLPGQDHGHAEDEVNAYELLRSNSMLTALMGLYIFSCATYNISGIAVTGALSAVHRVMIEALRTLIVWAFGLSIHYLVDPQSPLGEVWTPYSWLEVAGFLLLVIGQVIYGAMVKIPRLYYPPSEEISHDVVASPGSLRNLTALPDARLVSPGSHDGRVAGSPVALSP
ncbi:SLC35F6 [Symbiodinium sp. CCMP2592]|nr:SLC35F6 [Symbiodinium sp. CCMP2592]